MERWINDDTTARDSSDAVDTLIRGLVLQRDVRRQLTVPELAEYEFSECTASNTEKYVAAAMAAGQ